MANEWDQFPQASPIDVALHVEGVDGDAAKVARSIYEQESGSGRNTKTSNAGAVGGMQIIPATFDRMSDPGWDISDPVHNARAGVRYVKHLYDRSGGDTQLTAAGYYGGEGGQDKAAQGIAVADPRNPQAPNTLEYAQQVAGRMNQTGNQDTAPQAVPDNWDAFPRVETKADPAKRELPPTVKPSTVEGGRGTVNPPAAIQPRSTVQELGRQLGLTVRAGVQGVASLPAMASDAITGPINAGLDVVRGKDNGFRFQRAQDALGNVLTAAGVPQPETATERVVQDVASAVAGTGSSIAAGRTLANAASPVVSAIGEQLTAGPKLQAISAATGTGASGTVRENGGGPGAQIAAGLAGAMAPGFAGPAAEATVRGIVRGGEAGRQRMADNISLFNQAGTTPTLAQATNGRFARASESLLAKTPGGAGVIAKRAQGQADEMAIAMQKMSDELAPGASAVNAGEAISRGINAFKDGVKAVQQRLYAELDKSIASDTPVAVKNAQQALQALTADIPGAENLSAMFKNARIQGVSKALIADLEGASTTGTLPYRAVKELRSVVGRELADNSLVPDVPRAQWSKLYGALSDDLGEAAVKAGPQAETSWKWANTFTKQQMERLEQLKGIVAKDAPEKIFTSALAGTAEGDTIVKRIVNALPKAERREVAAAVLQRLGRATPGQQNAMGDAFSSETFLTNLAKLSAPARKTLFGRTDVKGLEERLAQIAKVAESRRDGGRVFANPSGTAPAAAQIALGGAGGVGVGTALATGQLAPVIGTLAVPLGANLIAKGVTSPRVTKFLARPTTLNEGAAASAVAAGSRAIAKGQQPEPSWDTFPEHQSDAAQSPQQQGVMPTAEGESAQASPTEGSRAPVQPLLDLQIPQEDGNTINGEPIELEDLPAELQDLHDASAAQLQQPGVSEMVRTPPVQQQPGAATPDPVQLAAVNEDASGQPTPVEVQPVQTAAQEPQADASAMPEATAVAPPPDAVPAIQTAQADQAQPNEPSQPEALPAPVVVSRLQRLYDAGETAVADHLKEVEGRRIAGEELAGLQQIAPDLPVHSQPDFGSAYRSMRAGGVLPAEAAARASMETVARSIATDRGMSPKAMTAMLDAAKGMPLAKVPAFIVKYGEALAGSGAIKPIGDTSAVQRNLEDLRDKAITAAIELSYSDKQKQPGNESLPSESPSNGLQQLSNSEQQTASPVAESQALEPSVSSDGGVATAQAGSVPIDGQDAAPAEPVNAAANDQTATQTAVAQAAPEVGDSEFKSESRSDGTLKLHGDAQAIRETLIAAGIPETSLLTSKNGVVVGRTQVAKVQAAIDRIHDLARLDEKAHAAATSPFNDKPEPTQEQKSAGNYAKGHVRFHGMDISVENPKDSTRKGVSPEGKSWEQKLNAHYGYIRRSQGADGDQVDVFIGPHPDSRKVFVVDQVNSDGSFDEHKSMLGYKTAEQAREAYLGNYEPGWQGIGAMTELPMAAFKAWVKSGRMREPLGELADAGDGQDAG